MTFSSRVKDEVSRLETSRTENIAELSAIIRNTVALSNKSIDITVENNAVARRIFKLIKDIYNITPQITVRKRYNFNKNLTYILSLKNEYKYILIDLSYYDEDYNKINIPKDYLISDEEDLRAYLRGLFIAVGSVNDPKTSRYHMEFLVNDNDEALSIVSLLSYFHINAKIINREKGYMVYVKDSENISDFLKLIGANRAVMYYEDIRAFRDKKNMANRLNNCEQANVDKVISAAKNQLEDCIYLLDTLGEKLINERLLVAITYRMKYPESSLEELSNIISLETGKNITKSGLNHRFRDIKNKVIALKENNN